MRSPNISKKVIEKKATFNKANNNQVKDLKKSLKLLLLRANFIMAAAIINNNIFLHIYFDLLKVISKDKLPKPPSKNKLSKFIVYNNKPPIYINKDERVKIKNRSNNIQMLLIEKFNITTLSLGIKRQTKNIIKTERISCKFNTGKLSIRLNINNIEIIYIINKKFLLINSLSIIYNFFKETKQG